MSSKPVKFYFGRLNLMGNILDKKDFILQGLKTPKVTLKRGHNWGFFEIDEKILEDHIFLIGYLVKYKPATAEEVAIDETHSLGDEEIKNLVVAKSRFLLHIQSGVVAYHAVSGQISDNQFRVSFAELFQEAFDNLFVSAEIQAIEEQFQIFEAIKKFSFISNVSIYLHPSNPSNVDRWKSIDERLKKLEAISYKEEYGATPNTNGLRIEEDEEVISKISMADDGYGKADVTGKYEGETKTISTSDNPITADAPGDNESSENVLKVLLKTFKKIFERFKK